MIERVKLLMSVKNLSSAQLAEMIGVQRSGISHILSGRNKPSLDFIVKVLETYPDLNESWLLKGEGEMLKSSPNNLFETKDDITVDQTVQELDELDKVKQVRDEETPYYGKESPTTLLGTETDSEMEPQADIENDLDTILLKKTIQAPHFMSKNQAVVKNKKLIKLIEIYSDNSFKVYHTE